MRHQLVAVIALAAFGLSACAPKDEPTSPEPEAPAASTEVETAPSTESAGISPTECAIFTASYPLNYESGSIVMTDGTASALDEEFKKLLPMAASCGNAQIVILQKVGDVDSIALATPRAAAVTALLNDEYDIPLYNLDSQIIETDTCESSISIEVSFAG